MSKWEKQVSPKENLIIKQVQNPFLYDWGEGEKFTKLFGIKTIAPTDDDFEPITHFFKD